MIPADDKKVKSRDHIFPRKKKKKKTWRVFLHARRICQLIFLTFYLAGHKGEYQHVFRGQKGIEPPDLGEPNKVFSV